MQAVIKAVVTKVERNSGVIKINLETTPSADATRLFGAKPGTLWVIIFTPEEQRLPGFEDAEGSEGSEGAEEAEPVTVEVNRVR